MEVHHHPKVKEKKFKEYFLEFLMIFLAVTLGFFAENIREHSIEHRRVKQYAVLLVSDLKNDTTWFTSESRQWLNRQNHFDSLAHLLIQPVPVTDKRIVKELLSVNYVSDAKMNTATYNQMKTSGSLRYISNFNLITALENYYEIQIPRVMESSQSTRNFFNDYIKTFFIDHLRNQDMISNIDTVKNWSPVILGRNRESDQRLSNLVDIAKTQLEIANRFYDSARNKAALLIELINKEYNLK
jgi:hypothetical protein